MWETMFKFCQIVVCFCLITAIIGGLMCIAAFIASGIVNPWEWKADARATWMFVSVIVGAILTVIFSMDGV